MTLIRGFPDYLITENGDIISFKNNKVKILKPSKNKGYPYVTLCGNGVVVKKQVHRLVAEAFTPNPDELPEVNHKDGVPGNPRKDNLEWCDRWGNEKHAYENGLKNIGKSKILGVTWCKDRKKWVVRFSFDGKRKFFGYYTDQIKAELKAKNIISERRFNATTY